MNNVPQAVIDESRRNIDEWAAESRMALASEEATLRAAMEIADVLTALGNHGAGRALVDAGYVASNFIESLTRVTGQQLDGAEALALLGMAGLVLTDREAGR